MKKTFVINKDPQSVLDYTLDWSIWLADGDAIASSTWDVPAPLTQPFAASYDATTATVWLAGGLVDATYTVTNHIVTTNSREEDAVLIFKIKDQF